MSYDKRIMFSILWVLIGTILNVCHFAGLIEEFWSSMGIALIIVGALQIFRFQKYKKNDEYREKMDIENSDERNKFIANKAWAWAGYVYVMFAAVMTIVFKIIDKEELMMAASMSVCFIITAYWISYIVLKKKY